MANQWFRRRKPSQGIGYGIAGWKGLVATVVFIVVTGAVAAGVTALPRWMGLPLMNTTFAGILAVLVLTGVFVVFVVSKSGER